MSFNFVDLNMQREKLKRKCCKRKSFFSKRTKKKVHLLFETEKILNIYIYKRICTKIIIFS